MYTAFDSLKGQHLSVQQVVFNQLLCYLIQLSISWHIPVALPFEIAMSGKIFKQLFNTKKGKTKQSANGVTTAPVSATTASAQSPEGAASVSDKVNASMHPNASSAVVPHNEEENSFIQGPSTSHGEEVDGDTSTAAQTAQQKETGNSNEQLPGE